MTALPSPPPSPWRWIPTLYFGQGLPYVVVMTLAVVMYKNLGVSNTEIALLTGWLYLPWVIKPLWSPLVELLGTPRRWVLAMQWLIGAALGGVALVLPGPEPVRATLAVLWLLAFASATHDIAADGFYLQALRPRQRAAFVGVRSTCYRLAMIAGQGGLIALAGWWQQQQPGLGAAGAWVRVFGLLGALFVLLALLHTLSLPRPVAGAPAPAGASVPAPTRRRAGELRRDFVAVFAAFLRRPDIGRVLAFLLLYRFAEAQLLKLVAPFALDAASAGGLGLSNQQLGLAYGTLGVAALTAGGLLGGWVISRRGLDRLLWPMVVCMHLPNLLFVALALWQPTQLGWISAALMAEQFGYGFGFAAYMVFMMMVAEGPHQTAHYAICTGFMALGMMLPGMAAGWLQSQLGYTGFFVWVCVATIPSFVAVAAVRIRPGYGREAETEL
ncbi:MFS transporter [Aquabacterium sp. OR-4]|uniref:MFS transporter n=1 Tax=Aquabacterium sp. OR-4 TaxID=2978127 RepID=UPI0021B1BCA1|nr:MFS transporter [Aquabacterium sp. OR-4]MDT7836778.1 MFS transporter [Aquabacterium sp. OR-4]